MSRLPIQTAETALPEALPRLQAIAKANGFLPNLIGVLANAPAALQMYQEVGAMNAATTLSPAEREVVQITSAVINDCHFCKAGHTAIATRKKLLADDIIQALRSGAALNDPRLNQLAVFTRAVMQRKGKVEDAELQAFLNAGYTERQALEVILGVALATLSNYANNLAQTPINPELQPYA